MSVITIDGHVGAGGVELGKRVARMFDLDFVDRIALPGSSPGLNLDIRNGVVDQFWSIVERTMSDFSLGNTVIDPYFSVPHSLLVPLTWDLEGPAVMSHEKSVDATLDSLFEEGNTVLVHRAGCLEFGDRPVFKVGIFSSWEARAERVMNREGFKSLTDAENVIRRREKLQREYFRDVHKTEPEDPDLYDMILNTESETIFLASLKVARLAREALALEFA